MRINGYSSAGRMAGIRASAGSTEHGRAGESTAARQAPGMAPRLAPVGGVAPSGPDMRFLAQMVGQATFEGEYKIDALNAYDRRIDDEDERPYWAGRPVRFLV
jgi:hypothetical protein